MSYYRSTYLKSEEWRTLRVAKLATCEAMCQACGKRSIGNDIHHLRYGNLHDVELGDLRVLCRRCHDIAHEVLKEYPALKKMAPKDQWRATVQHIKRRIGQQIAGLARTVTPPLKRHPNAFWAEYTASLLNAARACVGNRLHIKVTRKGTAISNPLCHWLRNHPNATPLAIICMAGRFQSPHFKITRLEPNFKPSPKIKEALPL